MQKFLDNKKKLLFLFTCLIFYFNYSSSHSFLSFARFFDKVLTVTRIVCRPPFFYIPKALYSPALQALDELLEEKKVSKSYVTIANKAYANNRSINMFFYHMAKFAVDIVKESFAKEEIYLEKKRGIYSVYQPISFTEAKRPVLHCLEDFDLLLAKMKSNLILEDHQKVEILTILQQMQRNAKRIKDDPQNSIRYTTQVFLYGPPGTAKTQLVYLIAEVTGMQMICLSVSSLTLLRYDAIRALGELIMEAKEKNILLFIDETELLMMKRSELISSHSPQDKSNSDDFASIIHDLLTVFLSYTGQKGINLIAATNKPDILDSAIARRFEHVIEMKLPGHSIRAKIFDRYFDNNNIKFADVTNKEAAEIGATYSGNFQEKIESNKDKMNALSGSEIKLICQKLTEMNQGQMEDGKNITYVTSKQLIETTKKRIKIHKIFDADRSLSTGGSISQGGILTDKEIVKYEERRINRIQEKTIAEDVIVRIELMGKIVKPQGPAIIQNYNIEFQMINRAKFHQIGCIRKNAIINYVKSDRNLNKPYFMKNFVDKSIIKSFAQIKIPTDLYKAITSTEYDTQIVPIFQTKMKINNVSQVVSEMLDEINDSMNKQNMVETGVIIPGKRKTFEKSYSLNRKLSSKILKKKFF